MMVSSASSSIVHSVAFAPREALKGDFHAAVSREAFRVSHDISSYSLAALTKAALPMMEGRRGSVVTLSYLGAVRSIPNYNVMGVAKAALEASVRYLAEDLGKENVEALKKGIANLARHVENVKSFGVPPVVASPNQVPAS